MRGYAWITLATNDPYCLGALVLAHSLKRVGTKHDLVILITPGVTSTMREKLNTVFSVVEEVNVLDSQDEANLALLARPELGITFTKLHCWKLTQYEKCVFVDADTLVVRNCDELFEREELSAAPDVGWPDCFNSGVFVFKPSQETFGLLTAFATSKGSFDGGDQGLLNQYFCDWAHKDISKHLPFIYNMCSTATYSYLPAYKQFGQDVKIVHFIGSTKPWLQYFDTRTGQVHPSSESGHLQSLLQHWWNIFCEMVHPQLSSNMARSTLAPIWHDSCPRVSTTALTLSNHMFNISTDVTYDKVDIPIPDFSEFHDPWEHYIEEANKCNQNHDSDEYMDDTDSIKKEENEYKLNNETTHKSLNMNDWGDREHNNYVYRSDHESSFTQKHVEHSENVDINLAAVENIKLTESHDEVNFLDECTNLQYCSSHDHYSDQIQKNNHCAYITHQRSQYDNSPDGTHYIQLRSDHQYGDDDQNLMADGDNRDCRNNIVYAGTHTIVSLTHSQTCTESKFIASQSKTNSFDDVAHDNTGIAGALAKMTLGMARSPEQEAFEEHMRKQSWEQGKIDYMGRDCFDNIWTKICSTISTATEHESTPPHENIDHSSTVAKSANTKIQAAILEAEVPNLQQPHEAIQEARLEANINEATVDLNVPYCEGPTSSAEMPNKYVPLELLSTTNAIAQNPQDVMQKSHKPVLALTCSIPKLCIEGSSKKCRDVRVEEPTAASQVQGARCICLPTVIPLPFSSEITLGSKTSAVIQVNKTQPEESLLSDESEKTKNIEINSVPIQVAESVLQADVKESVSEDLRPVTEEAISSISAPIQEFISAVMETPLEPPAPVRSQLVEASLTAQPNGTYKSHSNTRSNDDSEPRIPLISSAALQQKSLAVAEPICVTAPAPKSDDKKVLEFAAQFKEAYENVSQVERTPESESSLHHPQRVSQIIEHKASPTQNYTDILQTSESTTLAAPTTDTIIHDVESETNVPNKVSPGVEPSVTKTGGHQHETVLSTTKLKIPGTPTITEATPPTSPPLDATASLEEKNRITKKVVKKVIKKSSAGEKTDDNEPDDSKKLKKTVNKKGPSGVMKKMKESGESLEEGDCSSPKEKPKKTIKVKKTTKSVHNLAANTSVPDTPPPTTSDTPVPPKRKVKSSNAKSPTNRLELEP